MRNGTDPVVMLRQIRINKIYATLFVYVVATGHKKQHVYDLTASQLWNEE